MCVILNLNELGKFSFNIFSDRINEFICVADSQLYFRSSSSILTLFIFFFYVPRPFRALVIMALRNFLSQYIFVFFWGGGMVLFFISPKHCSSIHLNKLVKQVKCCFTLSLLPFVYPVNIKFYKPSFLIMFLPDDKYKCSFRFHSL